MLRRTYMVSNLRVHAGAWRGLEPGCATDSRRTSFGAQGLVPRRSAERLRRGIVEPDWRRGMVTRPLRSPMEARAWAPALQPLRGARRNEADARGPDLTSARSANRRSSHRPLFTCSSPLTHGERFRHYKKEAFLLTRRQSRCLTPKDPMDVDVPIRAGFGWSARVDQRPRGEAGFQRRSLIIASTPKSDHRRCVMSVGSSRWRNAA